MLRNQPRSGFMHALAARMKRVPESPRELEPCGLTLLQTCTFATPQRPVARALSLLGRLADRSRGRPSHAGFAALAIQCLFA